MVLGCLCEVFFEMDATLELEPTRCSVRKSFSGHACLIDTWKLSETEKRQQDSPHKQKVLTAY